MKKTLKIMSLILVLVLAIGAFIGCGKNEIKRERGKYTYWVNMNAAVSQTLSSYNDLLMYQELEKRTGIHVDFIHPAKGSTGDEAFQILLTSADMPDMVEYKWSSYAGGADKAIEDKVIISLNKYMKEAAPNYYSYMEGEKAAENGYVYKAESTSGSGNYYGFRNLCIGSYRNFGGLYVRKDLLDKWGLEVPVTIDDWTNVLKTAKENGIKKPLTGTNNLFSITGEEMFNIAWGVGKDYHVENGKVKFGPFEPEYKEYLEKMAQWHKAGYIDTDYITNDSEVVMGNMTTGVSVATYGYVGGGLGKILPAMAERDPNFNVVACPTPVLKEGDKAIIQDVSPGSLEPTIAITYNCGKDDEERYKEAMKWCDYLYSDEGIILKSFGVEGKTFYTEKNPDGSTKYKYIVSKPEEMEKIGAHSVQAALYHYFLPANTPGFNQHEDYLDGYYPYEQQKEAIKLWNANIKDAEEHALPVLSYTEEEAIKVNEITAICRDKFDAAISDIVRNAKGIETYDAAVKEAKDNGYNEIIKINQAAYDRYCAAVSK